MDGSIIASLYVRIQAFIDLHGKISLLAVVMNVVVEGETPPSATEALPQRRGRASGTCLTFFKPSWKHVLNADFLPILSLV